MAGRKSEYNWTLLHNWWKWLCLPGASNRSCNFSVSSKNYCLHSVCKRLARHPNVLSVRSSSTAQPLFTLTVCLRFQRRAVIHPEAPLKTCLQGEKWPIQQQLKTEPLRQLQPSIILRSITVTWPWASLTPAPVAHRHAAPQECWVMRDGKGGHPGVRLRSMLGRKGWCVMWGCACLFTLSRWSRAAQRPLSSGGKAGWAFSVAGDGVEESGEVVARSSWRRRIWDYCWHVGWSQLKTPQKYLLIACQSKRGSWTLKAFRLTLTVW